MKISEENFLDRIDGLLDIQRVVEWDGICVGDVTALPNALFDDAKIDDWPHRISCRIYDPEHNSFAGVREITMAQARRLGAKRFPTGRLVEVTHAGAATPTHITRLAAVMYGTEYRSLAVSSKDWRAQPKEKNCSFVNVMLLERYQWRARFRLSPESLAVEVQTDPFGAREAFKLRDVPEGKLRRSALRNWVCGHSRKRRAGSDRELVRAHLRGETRFNWRGLECELIPSQFDREKEIARNAE